MSAQDWLWTQCFFVTGQIVGVVEADISDARLSISSPLAKALIGKKVGDSISTPAPAATASTRSLQFSMMSVLPIGLADVLPPRHGSPGVVAASPQRRDFDRDRRLRRR